MIQSRRVVVLASHPAYAGHFPNFPVLPGAVLLDETLHMIADERGIDLCGWQIASAKFLGTVRPGDELRIEYDAASAVLIRFSLFARERKVVSGVIAAASPASS